MSLSAATCLLYLVKSGDGMWDLFKSFANDFYNQVKPESPSIKVKIGAVADIESTMNEINKEITPREVIFFPLIDVQSASQEIYHSLNILGDKYPNIIIYTYPILFLPSNAVVDFLREFPDKFSNYSNFEFCFFFSDKDTSNRAVKPVDWIVLLNHFMALVHAIISNGELRYWLEKFSNRGKDEKGIASFGATLFQLPIRRLIDDKLSTKFKEFSENHLKKINNRFEVNPEELVKEVVEKGVDQIFSRYSNPPIDSPFTHMHDVTDYPCLLKTNCEVDKSRIKEESQRITAEVLNTVYNSLYDHVKKHTVEINEGLKEIRKTSVQKLQEAIPGFLRGGGTLIALEEWLEKREKEANVINSKMDYFPEEQRYIFIPALNKVAEILKKLYYWQSKFRYMVIFFLVGYVIFLLTVIALFSLGGGNFRNFMRSILVGGGVFFLILVVRYLKLNAIKNKGATVLKELKDQYDSFIKNTTHDIKEWFKRWLVKHLSTKLIISFENVLDEIREICFIWRRTLQNFEFCKNSDTPSQFVQEINSHGNLLDDLIDKEVQKKEVFQNLSVIFDHFLESVSYHNLSKNIQTTLIQLREEIFQIIEQEIPPPLIGLGANKLNDYIRVTDNNIVTGCSSLIKPETPKLYFVVKPQSLTLEFSVEKTFNWNHKEALLITVIYKLIPTKYD
ncbi:MAG: hypothetical protein ABIK48_05890 [candidate division WOR-3 bacterium]